MNEEIYKNSQAFWHNFFSAIFLALVASATYYLNLTHKLGREISWFDFTLLFFATFRLIRLFVYDTITEHVRGYLRRYSSGYRRELSMLINCPWCTGIWAGLFVAFIFFLSPLTHFFVLLLAISGLGSIVQTIIWRVGLDPRERGK
ncbi:MAG: DUF1360 domain-containing protein [Parcubacteria group bacterium]